MIKKMADAQKAADFEHISNFQNNGKTFWTTILCNLYRRKVSKFSQKFFAIAPVQREKPDELKAGYSNRCFKFPDWQSRHVVQCQCNWDVLEIV